MFLCNISLQDDDNSCFAKKVENVTKTSFMDLYYSYKDTETGQAQYEKKGSEMAVTFRRTL